MLSNMLTKYNKRTEGKESSSGDSALVSNKPSFAPFIFHICCETPLFKQNGQNDEKSTENWKLVKMAGKVQVNDMTRIGKGSPQLWKKRFFVKSFR